MERKEVGGMILDTNIRVVMPRWRLATFDGCCGAAVIARLGASYTTEKGQAIAKKAYFERPTVKPLKTTPVHNDYFDVLARAAHCHDMGPGAAGFNHSMAMTPRAAFACLIHTASKRRRQAIYFMADNLEEVGDVHTGIFSTKNFVQFIRLEGLGAVQEASPIQSTKTQRQLGAWIWTPDWAACNKLTSAEFLAFKSQVKEFNRHDRLKGPNELSHKEFSDTQRGYQEQFSSW